MIKINLLPFGEKKILKRERVYQLIAIALIVFIIGTCLVALELTWAKILLKDNFPTHDSSLNRNKELVENIKNLNGQFTTIDKIQNEYLPVSPLLSNLIEISSDDIRIKMFNFDRVKKIYQVRGWAKNRQALISLQIGLEKIYLFKKVQTPLTNLLKQENIDFELSGELNL